MAREIVKVQTPIMTTEETRKYLIYGFGRSCTTLREPPADLIAKMRGRPKAYFNAEYNPVKREWTVFDEVEPQRW